MALERTVRLALVTGATGGIGREIAFQMAEKGYGVLITGRDERRGAATLQLLRQLYPDAPHDLWLGDLSELEQVAALAEWARLKGIHVLILNAGGAFPADSPLKNGLSQTFLLNLLSPWLLATLLIPDLMAQDDPRIVFVSSALHYFGDPRPLAFAQAQTQDGPLAYCTIKHAALAVMQHMQRELGDRNLTLLAADPGIADTANFASNSQGLSGALIRGFWMSTPAFQTKRKAAKSTIVAATSQRGSLPSGTLIGPDGQRQAPATSTKEIQLGRHISALCREMCNEWLADEAEGGGD